MEHGLPQQDDVGGRPDDRVAGLTPGQDIGIGEVPRSPRVHLLVVAGPVGGERDRQSLSKRSADNGRTKPRPSGPTISVRR